MVRVGECVELTFELPDSAKECFHEEITQGTESTLEFQVCMFKGTVKLTFDFFMTKDQVYKY